MGATARTGLAALEPGEGGGEWFIDVSDTGRG
jgi:hypothetical protein